MRKLVPYRPRLVPYTGEVLDEPTTARRLVKYDGPVVQDQSPIDAPLHEPGGAFETFAEHATGESIRKKFGGLPAGSEQVRQLGQQERGSTAPSEWTAPLAFGANVGAGTVGLVGAPAVLAADVVLAASRELSETAARLTLPLWLPEGAQRNIAGALERGELSWDAHSRRLASRTEQGLTALVEGVSPATTAAVLASGRGEDAGTAAADSWFTHPVENLIPFVLAAKAATKVGGKARTMEVPLGERTLPKGVAGPAEQVKVPVTPTNLRGQALKLNELGWRAFDKTPDSLKPFVWDVESPVKAAVRQRTVEAQSAKIGARSKAAADAQDFLRSNDAALDEAAFDFKREFESGNGRPPTEVEVKRYVEGKWHGEDVAVAKQVRSVVADDADLHSRGVLHKTLVDAGLPEDSARLVMGKVDALVPHVLDGAAVPEGGALAGALAADAPRKAAHVYDDAIKGLERLDDAQKATAVAALERESRRLSTDPAWVAFAEKPYDSQSGYSWRPRPQDAVDEYRKTWGEIHAQEERARVEQGVSQQVSFPVSEYGELHKTRVFELWKQESERLGASPNGRAKMLALLRSDPLSRFVADPKASPVSRWVAAKMNNPTDVNWRLRQQQRALQVEIAQNLGIDPVVMAKHFDEYLSHALRQAAEWSKDVGEPFSQRFLGKAGQKPMSPRFGRKLSPDEHAQWYEDLADEGRVDAPSLVKFTLENTAALAQRMHALSEQEVALRKAGLISDVKREGWTYLGKELEAKTGAASGDPYNFVLGRMAGKWVDPRVGEKLGLVKHEFGKVLPVIGIWKLLHTVYNPFGYQQGNHLGDFVMMGAATGHSPYSAPFRKAWADSVRSLERFEGWGEPGKPAVRHADKILVEALERDVVRPGLLIQHTDVGDTPVGKAVRSYVDVMQEVVEKELDPVQGSAALARVQAYLEQSKGWLPYAKGLPRNLVDRFNRVMQATREAVQAEQGVRAKSWTGGSTALDQLHRELRDSAMARWTALQENQRRLTLYRFGRQTMKLDADAATRLVQETLTYGNEWPQWAERMRQSTAGQLMLPPFLSYGVHQLRFSALRAVHEPRLWAASLLAQAVQGWDAQRLAQQGEDDDRAVKDWFAQLQIRALTSFGANRAYLGNNHDLAESFQSLGFQGPWVDSIRGGDLTHTLPLRNWANLTHMVQRWEPGQEVPVVLSRQAPAFDFFLTHLMDPDVYSQVTRGGVTTFRHGAWDQVAARLTHLGELMLPTYGVEAKWRAMLAAYGMTQGSVERTGKTGAAVGKLEAMRAFTPALAVSPLDKVAMAVRLKANFEMRTRDLQQRASRRTSSLSLVDSDDLQLRTVSDVDLAFAVANEQLAGVRAMLGSGAVPDQVFADLRQKWDQTLDRVRSGEVVTKPLQEGLAGRILAAVEDSLDEVWDEQEDEQDGQAPEATE